MTYKSFLATHISLIETLFGKIKAILQPASVNTPNPVPDSEQMLKLRRAVHEITEVVMPCIELTEANLFQRVGFLYFWQFGRGLSKDDRYRYQTAALRQVPDYVESFTELRDVFDSLEQTSPEAAKLFGELLCKLHPVSAERFKPNEQASAKAEAKAA